MKKIIGIVMDKSQNSIIVQSLPKGMYILKVMDN